MFHRLYRNIRTQALLRDIGLGTILIYQYVVPGLALGRMRGFFFHGLCIPFLGTQILGIHVRNHTPVAELGVPYDLSDAEFCLLFVHFRFMLCLKLWSFPTRRKFNMRPVTPITSRFWPSNGVPTPPIRLQSIC